MTDGTVAIGDIPAFPGRIAEIRTAIEQLRAASAALNQIPDTAVKEAASFTRDGSPAPVYSPLVEALRGWTAKLIPAVKALCDSAEAAADTAAYKFNGVVSTDQEGKRGIEGLGSGGVTTLTSKRTTGPTGTGADGAKKSFAELEKEIGAKAGVAYMPLFGDNREVKTVGDLQTGDGWSTMKAPVVLAALQENGGVVTDDMRRAITASDNDAAGRIWDSLGDPNTAAGKVQDVLRDAGDTTTVVNSVKDSQWSAFGQTQWSLGDQLKFMNYVNTDTSAAPLLNLMGQVSPDQQWGLGQRDGAAFKGGWGPSGDNGEYLTRQMGIVDGPGGKYAVAVMTAPESGTFDAGQDATTRLSQWLDFT